MSTTYCPYEQNSVLQQLSQMISSCDEDCRVKERHPFYPTPEQPPFYYGKRPLLPVVPTYLAQGKVMILGEYPNCRFAEVARPTGEKIEAAVPVGDINEPFETGRYFNGRQVQLYPTGQSLQDYYLTPLGINLATDVWLTNVVKCFLIKACHVKTYKRLGWIGQASQPKVSSSHPASYFKIAATCMMAKLAQEIPICQPKLVIGLGEYVYRMMHSNNNQQPAPDPGTFGNVTGVPLLAGQASHPADRRHPLFANLNVVHLFHPSLLARQPGFLAQHLDQDIPNVVAFMQQLGLHD